MANRKPSSQGERRVRGQARAEAAFPAAPSLAELPGDYLSTLEEIRQRIQKERLRVVVSANQAMVRLYWDLGRLILERQGQRAGGQGHRPAGGGSPGGLPRDEGVFTPEPALHAGFCRSLPRG